MNGEEELVRTVYNKTIKSGREKNGVRSGFQNEQNLKINTIEQQ